MMLMCTSKFEIEEEQLAFINEYLSSQEIQAANEEKDAQRPRDDLDPISDDEEDDLLSAQVQTPSQRALGKRRMSTIDLGAKEGQEPPNESNDDGEIPLPDNTISLQEGSSTQFRTSGRVRNRPRHDDDMYIYK